MNNSDNSAADSLAEELFGKPDEIDSEITLEAINEVVSEASLMGDLGTQVDPDMADEICAEVVSIGDLERIHP